jgi:hypothetical protein
MRPTRTLTASLAAVLGVAALAGPAAAGQQGANDAAKANVYVPPTALYTAAPAKDSTNADVYVPPAALYTAAPAKDPTKANVYVPPTALYTAAPAKDSAKANVYVPPAALYTAAPAHDSAKANVYVPPIPQPVSGHVASTSASSSGFDWGSAAIGAAAVVGAFLIALAGAAVLRRRRQIEPAATA